jgi:3-methyl-2-oxobutanoate hydroxymethyltransferase
MAADIETAVKAYAAEVRSRAFPGKENVYSMKKTA